MLIRVIDIGSNSVKASVYEVQNQATPKALSKEKLPLSLGEEAFGQGFLSDASQEKVIAFLTALPGWEAGEKVRYTLSLATSATRSARNGEAFARKVQQATGQTLRILTGEEESFLIHTGIASKAEVRPDEVLGTMDIGGGSAEIGWSRGMEYLQGHSYPLGAIRLSQRFLKGKPFSRGAWDQISELATREFSARFAARSAPPSQRAIGSSGNIRAICRMVGGVRGLPFLKVMPEITVGSLEDVAELCVGRSPQNIQNFFDVNLERARIIMPAVVVLVAAMRHFGIPRLAVSDAGLREGAIRYWSRHGHLNLPVGSCEPSGRT